MRKFFLQYPTSHLGYIKSTVSFKSNNSLTNEINFLFLIRANQENYHQHYFFNKTYIIFPGFHLLFFLVFIYCFSLFENQENYPAQTDTKIAIETETVAQEEEKGIGIGRESITIALVNQVPAAALGTFSVLAQC